MKIRRFPVRTLTLALLCLGLYAHADDGEGTRLLSQPAVSKDHLAFVYAGDIWVTDRNGQHPNRITTHPASEFAPHFSPDGKWIAFSASYDNNIDVYVVPVEGGQPRRLTWHPAPDIVTGWSADGKRVLFTSTREVSNSRSGQLYEVPLEGGYEQKVMKAVAVEGAWSPDGSKLAYRPYIKAYSGTSGWRQHRGGDTPPLWILDPKSNVLEKIPHENASDSNPMWVGDEIAFISDRADGAANLFAYNTRTHAVRQLTHEKVWDVRSASAYGNTVVYEVGGLLKAIDLQSGQTVPIPVHITEQSIQARPQWKDASKNITSASLSPTGKRVLFTARGDVFSVPVKDGVVRNLTATSGIRESDALWSSDGQRVAYLSDEGGHQSLMIRDAAGLEKPVHHALKTEGYLTLLAWSPDDARVIYQDNHLNLYAYEIAKGIISQIDTSRYRSSFSPAFSPDGQWLAYTVVGDNLLTHVRMHSFATGRNVDVAESLVQTDNPVFGDGGLLYFTASIDAGLTRSDLDMSTQERPLRKAIYALVLAADGNSPLPPKLTDEEPKDTKGKAAEKSGKGEKDGKEGKDEKSGGATKVDLEGLQQRLVPIPVSQRNYDDLLVGADGSLYYVARRQPGTVQPAPGAESDATADLYRFNFEDREEKLIKSGVSDIQLSGDRKKLLLIAGEGHYSVADAGEKLDPKSVDVSGLRALVDPRKEWHQIFDETWRMERDYFYDPKLHGLDWQAVRARYEPLVDSVARREDLNDLLVQMIGELQVGHNRVGGGDVYNERPAGTGLLGADLRVEKGVYRIQKIYHGDRWNPFLVAPLAVPGLGVAEGDAILAINGHSLDATTNIYSLLEGTVDKPVSLTVSHDGTAKSAKTVVVTPVASETALRQWAWVEHNREYVDRQSGGKLAYVYLPDTADQGYAYFNRMFFAQSDKQGLIVDDRRNSGGQAANYVLETLNRRYLAGWKDRDAAVYNTPAGAIYGPKAMLIDQDAGSGGDFFPYGFKRLGLGDLIGTRTWGGLIGIAANPPLIDGGSLTVPFFRVFSPEGKWVVENEGVAPDIEVDLDPVSVNEGRDVQLDAAIANVMGKLKTAAPVALKSPPPMPTQLGK